LSYGAAYDSCLFRDVEVIFSSLVLFRTGGKMAATERNAWMLLLAVRDKIQTAEQCKPYPLYSYMSSSSPRSQTASPGPYPEPEEFKIFHPIC
jgi:hypothetical protein